MSFTSWVKGLFSLRGKAISLYRSGMAKATKHDFHGAIADYSAAIQEPHFPTDVKAMAIYNRALAYSAIHDDAKAIEDLDSVLEMPASPANIKSYAQERRARIRQRCVKGTDSSAPRKSGYL
jgi:hypothetical protein